MTKWLSAKEAGLVSCHTCGLMVRMGSHKHSHCPRCNAHLHYRTPASIRHAWAFLIAAITLYLPANLLPVMSTVSMGKGQADTIFSGAVYLYLHGNWPLAVIIFVASLLVPFLKIITLCYLLISVQRRSTFSARQRTKLYRLTEVVGRWSMVDVFVVAILVALVQIGAIATVEPGMGASAFAAVVVLTMFAAMQFDPRLIWDHKER